MGLDTTFDCFHGAYSSFMRFREELAKAAGMPELRRMENFADSGGFPWGELKPDAIHVLLNHSDCDGWIERKDLLPLATRLEELADKLPQDSVGHIARAGGYRATALQFAIGLRAAHKAGKRVKFQ